MAYVSCVHCVHCVHCFTVFFAVSVSSSFQLSLFSSVLVFLSQVSYLSRNRLFLDLFIVSFTFLVPFKTFLVFFTLCARLNWQLAFKFSSANHRIVSYRIALRWMGTSGVSHVTASARLGLSQQSCTDVRRSGVVY